MRRRERVVSLLSCSLLAICSISFAIPYHNRLLTLKEPAWYRLRGGRGVTGSSNIIQMSQMTTTPEMKTGPLLWIPKGQTFDFNDIVFWLGKQHSESFEAVVGRFTTIVLGPHASAAFPEELKGFIAPELTARKQHDFSDVITGPIGRAWAAADPRVVFIENPHSRVALDANRAHDSNLEPKLRDFFSRLRNQRAGVESVTFGGVDGVRPVTFSGEDVLLEPSNEADWTALMDALNVSATNGMRAYQATVERVVAAVRAARKGLPLTIIGLHDTSNHKMRADGAIVIERPVKDRLPKLINFGNLGDSRGELSEEESLRMIEGSDMRRVAVAWSQAFGHTCDPTFAAPAENACDDVISFNRPYAGGVEVKAWASRLRAEGDLTTKVFQVEFERDALLGPTASAALREPGDGWPERDETHIDTVAASLKAVNDILEYDSLVMSNTATPQPNA